MVGVLDDLVKLGKGGEVDRWAERYTKIKPHEFALLKISGKCIDEGLEDIAFDIAALDLMGLCAPIVFGWGDELTKRLKKDNITCEWRNGERITPPPIMERYVLHIAEEYGSKVVDALRRQGVNAVLCNRVIKAEPRDWPDVDYEPRNGRVVDVDTDTLIGLVNEGTYPIISPIGYSSDGGVVSLAVNQNIQLSTSPESVAYNINSDTVAKWIVRKLKPLKYVQLTTSGGIRRGENGEGDVIPYINVGRGGNYDELISSGIVTGGMAKKLEEDRTLLLGLSNGRPHCVQIADPRNLIPELFTDDGQCTKIVAEHQY
jgi:acetylglutamate kinase